MKLYGIAEIAEALGEDRHTVAQWYRRSRNGLPGGMDLPKPDQVLYMGPVWTGQTLSPWLKSMKRRMKMLTHDGPPPGIHTARQIGTDPLVFECVRCHNTVPSGGESWIYDGANYVWQGKRVGQGMRWEVWPVSEEMTKAVPLCEPRERNHEGS